MPKRKNGVGPDKNLSERERMFCEEYLETFNALASYKKVFDSTTQGSALASSAEIMKRPHIKKYLEDRRAELAEHYNISKEFLIKECLSIIESAKGEEKTDRKEWNKAIDLLAKLTAAYTTKVDVNQDIVIRFDFDTDINIEKKENNE